MSSKAASRRASDSASTCRCRSGSTASKTKLAISAGTVLADQLLRRGIKGPLALLVCQSLKDGEGLAAEAAVVPACPQLQLLVQGIGQVADLECCHRSPCRSALTLPRNGLGATCLRLVKNVMPPAVTQENATGLLQFSDQFSSFQVTTSSPILRIPGRSCLENSW